MKINYGSLSFEELGRLTGCDEGARQYVADHAEEFFLELGEKIESRINYAYREGYEDGMDEGDRRRNEDLSDRFHEAITDVLMDMDIPERLGKKKLRIHTLLCQIQEEIDR